MSGGQNDRGLWHKLAFSRNGLERGTILRAGKGPSLSNYRSVGKALIRNGSD